MTKNTNISILLAQIIHFLKPSGNEVYHIYSPKLKDWKIK